MNLSMLVVKKRNSNRLIGLYVQITDWCAKKMIFGARLIRQKYVRYRYKVFQIQFVRQIYAIYLKLRKSLFDRFEGLPKLFKLYVALLSCLFLIGVVFFVFNLVSRPNYQLTSADNK